MAGVDGERELEEFLAGALSGKAEPTPPAEPETVEEPEVVRDERPGVEPLPDDGAPAPSSSPDEAPAAEAEEVPAEEPTEEEGEGDPNVEWATKKFGAEPEKWARAAYEREQHISRLSAEKQQAEQVARQAIEYAQQMEASAQATTTASMPISAAEEEWVEQSMVNPAAAAYQAARAGNVQLYNAVIERVAEDNPGVAAQIGTQVNLALNDEARRLHEERNAAAVQNGQPDLNADLGQSFQRLQIDVQKYGPSMWEKIDELGEYHPYTLAILGGDPFQRDLAVQAVYDLVRVSSTTTRRVADSEREEQIRREGELRREAAGVVTGSPHVAPQKEDPLFAGMEEEWRRRGQWPYPAE
jgi:hypothetical protein